MRPLILIPGILGSEIVAHYKGHDTVVWPATTRKYISKVACLYDEESHRPIPEYDTTAGDIVRSVKYGPISVAKVYGPFIETMAKARYKEGTSLFVFPYDWRFGNSQTADLLNMHIETVLERTGADSVDLACHSMGGLVALRWLLNDPERRSDLVGRCLLFGSPLLGAPKAYATIIAGISPIDNWFVHWWEPKPLTWKEVGKNFPSGYELCPDRHLTELYIEGSFVTLNRHPQDYDQSYLIKEGGVDVDTVINRDLLALAAIWQAEFYGHVRRWAYLLSEKTWYFAGAHTSPETPRAYDAHYKDDRLATVTFAYRDPKGDGTVLNAGIKETLGINDDHMLTFYGVDHLGLIQNKHTLEAALHVLSSSGSEFALSA